MTKKPTYYTVIYFNKNNDPIGLTYTNDKLNFIKHTRIPPKQLDFIPIYRSEKVNKKHKKTGGL